jgi:hypothetical protein
MSEFRVRVPKSLEGERKSLEVKVSSVINLEEKRKLLSDMVDDLLKGGNQVGDSELVSLGRMVKKGRAERLRSVAAQ